MVGKLSFLGLCGLFIAAPAIASPPVVAVFQVETRGVRLSKSFAETLSEFVGVQLTSSGQYKLVPRSELRAALRRQKSESYKECYQESCQIEVGKELAANKTVSTKISKVGKLCLVTLALYDLRTSTAERASSHRGSCSDEALLNTVQKATSRLLSGGLSNAPPREPQPAERPEVTKVAPKPPRSSDRVAMVWIPEGNFISGCQKGQSCKKGDPKSQRVYTNSFWIDKVEVTVRRYKQCVEAGGCTAKDLHMPGTDRVWASEHAGACTWNKPNRIDHPINCLEIFRAEAYCKWAGKRLPTQREWGEGCARDRRADVPLGQHKPTRPQVRQAGERGRPTLPRDQDLRGCHAASQRKTHRKALRRWLSMDRPRGQLC